MAVMEQVQTLVLWLILLGMSACVPSSSAYTFNGCKPYMFSAIDPNTGTGLYHFHTFFGSDKLSRTTDTSASLSKGCSSCENTLDKSTYWIPTLFGVYRNGSMLPLTPRFRAYYQGIGPNTTPFPRNFKMIGGNKFSTSPYDAETVASGVNWYCSSGEPITKNRTLANFPTIQCQKGVDLAVSVFFPACYKVVKGQFVTAHKTVRCAKGYKEIPQMWYSMRYDISAFQWGADGTAPLWLSTGPSYTMHGDFFNGWPQARCQEMIKHPDKAGEFFVGGSRGTNNSPPCTIKTPSAKPADYKDHIWGRHPWSK